jgi:hypothetical protein
MKIFSVRYCLKRYYLKKKIIIGLLFVIFTNNSFSQESDWRSQLPHHVYDFSQKYDKYLRGIVHVESDSGKFKNGDDGKSFGMMMIKIEAYKDVVSVYPKFRVDNPQERLLNDNDYNLIIGTIYLYLLHQKLRDIELAVIAYNVGISTVLKFETGKKYLKRVKRRIKD